MNIELIEQTLDTIEEQVRKIRVELKKLNEPKPVSESEPNIPPKCETHDKAMVIRTNNVDGSKFWGCKTVIGKDSEGKLMWCKKTISMSQEA